MDINNIILSSEAGITTVSLPGKLEAEGVYHFKSELKKVVDRYVIFDFTRLLFIDSAGLGALIGFFKQVRKRGGDIKIVLLNPSILKMFEITRMDRIFKLYRSCEDARASFKEEIDHKED